MEQFANNCSAIVASGGYTAGSGVLNVNSTAAPWPQVGDFRISIFGQNTNSLKVILKVTAINSSTQFAVTAEGTDANADAGDLVYGCVVTAGVMKNIGWVLIAEKTASNSATLDFTDLPTSLYDEFHLEFINIVPATSNAKLKVRCSTDNGSNYDAGNNYGSETLIQGANWSGWEGGVTGQSSMELHCAFSNTAAQGGGCGSADLYNLASTSMYKNMRGCVIGYADGGYLYICSSIGRYISTTAVNAIRILMDSGNITSGTVRLFGVAK